MAQTNLNITATFDGAQAKRGLKDLELAGLRVGDAIDTGNKMAVRALGRMLSPLLLFRQAVGLAVTSVRELAAEGRQMREMAEGAHLSAAAFADLRARILAAGGAQSDFNRELEALKAGKTTLEAIRDRWTAIRKEGRSAAEAAKIYERESQHAFQASLADEAWGEGGAGRTLLSALGAAASHLVDQGAYGRAWIKQNYEVFKEQAEKWGKSMQDEQELQKFIDFVLSQADWKNNKYVTSADANGFSTRETATRNTVEFIRGVAAEDARRTEERLDATAFQVWKGLGENLAEAARQLQRIKGFEGVGEDTVRVRVERHRGRYETDADRAVRLGKEALDAASGVAEGPAPGALSFGWTAGGGAIQGVNYPGFSIKQETAVDVLKEAVDSINAELQQVRTITLGVEDIVKALRGEL